MAPRAANIPPANVVDVPPVGVAIVVVTTAVVVDPVITALTV